MQRHLLLVLSVALGLITTWGHASATAQTVSFSGPPAAVGAGLQSANFYVGLSDSQHGGVFLTLASSDSTLAFVARDQVTPGAGTVSHFVPNGINYAYFTVQGLENVTGTVTITASAPGFADAQTDVNIDTPQFRLTGLATEMATIDPDDVFTIQTGRPSGTSWLAEKVRTGGPGLTAGIALSDPTAADLVTTAQTGPSLNVSIAGGQSTSPTTVPAGGVALSPVQAGTTDVTATIAGFVGQDGGVVSVTVDPASITYTGLPMKLGAGLRSRNGSVAIFLNGTAHGGTAVHLASLDSSLVLLATDNITVGSGSVDLFVPDGESYGIFYVHGLEGVAGIGSVEATAPGFVTASDGVEVVAGGMVLKNLVSTLSTLDPSDSFNVEVGVPDGSGTNIAEQQPVRPGSPGLDIALICDNPAVGLLESNTASGDTVWVQIPPGTWGTSAAFNGVGAGTATIYPVSAGFIPTLNAFQTVTVTQPYLYISNNGYTVGSGLQSACNLLLSAPLHGGTTVQVSVDNPANALVSDGPATVGGQSLEIFVPDGSRSGIFYLQAIEGYTGVVNLTATASGFADTVQVYDVVVPAISIKMADYYRSTLGDLQTEISIPDEFVAEIGPPSGPNSVSAQPLRAGSPGIDVTAQVDDPVVGAVVTTSASGASVSVRIEALGKETSSTLVGGGFAFDGLSAGPVTVTVSSPGFLPQGRAAKTLTVAPAAFLTGPPADVGAGLVGGPNYWQLNGPDHGGTTVHVAVSDPDIALVSPDEFTPGVAALDLFIPDGSNSVLFRVHALEDTTGTVTLDLTAPGFVTSQVSANVVTPYVGMQALPVSQDVNAQPSNVVVRIGTPNLANSAVTVLQPRRPGGPLLMATVASSDAGIAELLNLSGAAASFQIEFAEGSATTPVSVANGGLGLSGVGPGVVLVDASIPGFMAVGTATQEVTVVQNGVALLGFPAALGAGLQTEPLVARLNSSAHGGTFVRLASSYPAGALVSTGVLLAGTDTVQVFVPDGQQDAVFHIQALEGIVGGVVINALVDGFVVGSRTVDVVMPGVVLVSLADSLRLIDPADEFLVQVGVPAADATGLAVSQSVRAGALPLVCPLVLDNGLPADLASLTTVADSLAVVIAPGAFQSAATVAAGGVALMPIAAGTVTVAALPPGFAITVGASQSVVIRDDLSPVGDLPAATTLHGNYPNPFNPSTKIAFSLSKAGQVQLKVYDIRGRMVRNLLDGGLSAGSHAVRWDGTDDRGRSQAAGIYFVRLQAPDGTLTHKVALVK